MTEAIISAVVKKLADLLFNEAQSLRGVNRKIDEVKLRLGQMQRFLEDAESKKKTGDERMKGWVDDVRRVTYETEDAIDTFLVEANYRWLGLIPNGLFAGRSLGEKISKIQAKLHIITESRTTFGIQDLSGDRAGHSESLPQKQPSFKRRVLPDVDNIEVVGFDAEKRDIINLLLHGTSSQSRLVVSIVGPGGIGKTTLAQKVYNSPIVKNHFDSCIWITVSQDFNLLDALKKIRQKLVNETEFKQVSDVLNKIHQKLVNETEFKQVSDVLKKIHQKLLNETELKQVSDVLKELQEEDQIVLLLEENNALLKEKKYLIVLDDVWAENVFTQLEIGLVDVKNGSRVLMTTRNLNVANRADSSGVYHLQFLNEEESFRLFLKKAFPSSDPSLKCPDELSYLAVELVKKCDGLPLALIVLGGLLSSKTTFQEWSRVLNRLDWHKVHGGECMKILATSYDDLPYLLKSCFRYLACFPEDYKIEAKRVMNMWIAEGLIEVNQEGEFEDFAEDYLEELVQRCLVQIVERSPHGAIKSIWVHDLLREVALREAKENDFLLIWKEENAERDVSMKRRVAFHNEIHPRVLTEIKMPSLRTLINFGRDSVTSVSGIGFLLLRVLELRNKDIRYLPTNLKNMIHLRYLGLRDTKITLIPSWIGHLQNLQTFDIRGTCVKELPKSLWKISSLRHVHSPLSRNLVGPPSTANLVNLRSLGSFKAPKSWEKSLPNYLLGIRKLKLVCGDNNDDMLVHDLIPKLNNLLSVGLYDFDPPRGMIDFSTSRSYQNIHTMHLSQGIRNDAIIAIAEMPPNLTKLTLVNYSLNDDPMPKLERLRSLKCLELSIIDIKADTIVCMYGGFPRLQSLKLFLVKNINEWKVEYGALPMLKYLHIQSCRDLRALPNLQYVTTLQELRIDGQLHSKIENKSGEEWNKVKHIPTIINRGY